MKLSLLPKHVAIIMDGNGRWAKKRGKLRFYGHQAGVKSVYKAVSFAINKNINVLTLYTFSSENWNRPLKEVYFLMELFFETLNNEISNFLENNIKLCFIGDLNKLSIKLQNLIKHIEYITKNNTVLTINIALNYGGRWDIIQGIKKLAIKVQKGILTPDQIDEHKFSKYICMNELAPVDLLIRTGGELRISNFLLWQIAYTELFFTDILWPDFNEIIFDKALNSYSKRNRRYGRI